MESDLDKIQGMLDASNKTAYTSGPKSKEDISAVEDELGVKFPKSFWAYLARWGTLSIGSKEFYGITKNRDAIPDSSWLTQQLRKEVNLPEPLVVVIDDADGDEFVCIDCSKTIGDDECAIVVWDNINKEISDVFDMTFLEILIEELEDYLG